MQSFLLAVAWVTAITALTITPRDQAVLGHSSASDERYLIELGPGDTRWIVEEEKWALRRVCLS